MTKIDTTHTLFRSNADRDDYPVFIYVTSTLTVQEHGPDGLLAAYTMDLHQCTDQDGGDVELSLDETAQVLEEILATYVAQKEAN